MVLSTPMHSCKLELTSAGSFNRKMEEYMHGSSNLLWFGKVGGHTHLYWRATFIGEPKPFTLV